MAMTNLEIVTAYKASNGIPIETPLLTFAAWRKNGRVVKKGEKCKHQLTMWKHTSKPRTDKNGNEIENNYCFPKTMYLFEKSQTEPIK